MTAVNKKTNRRQKFTFGDGFLFFSAFSAKNPAFSAGLLILKEKYITVIIKVLLEAKGFRRCAKRKGDTDVLHSLIKRRYLRRRAKNQSFANGVYSL